MTAARRSDDRPRTARRFGVALLAALVAFALAELLVRAFVLANPRLVWRPLPPFTGMDTDAQRSWLERQERELAGGAPLVGYGEFDALLGWTNRPSTTWGGGTVHINSHGLRGGREYPDERSPGIVRILASGESFTFGAEVADDEAWPARLEQGHPLWEVCNLGVGAYGTDQALLRLRTTARAPVDAVLVGLLLENIGRNVNRYRPLWFTQALPAAKPRLHLGSTGLELVPLPFADREEFVRSVRDGDVLARLHEHEYWSDPFVPAGLRWSAIARLLGARRAYAARQGERMWRDVEGEPFRTTLAILAAFRDAARDLGTERTCVLVFPDREDLQGLVERGNRYWTPLLGALERLHLDSLDLSEPLAAAARRSSAAALYVDSHLSALGNEVVTEAIAAHLESWFPDSR